MPRTPKKAARSNPKAPGSKWWASAVPKDGKRSTLEADIAAAAEAAGLPLEHEPQDSQLGYMLTYQPDFRLPNGILVEAKGYFDSEDRTKMKRVKQANPERDIRFVFPRDNRIPRTKLRYSDWCLKNGFPYVIAREIPKDWWNE